MAGALVTCIPVAPDGTVRGAVLGQVVTGVDGAFSISAQGDVAGRTFSPIRQSSSVRVTVENPGRASVSL